MEEEDKSNISAAIGDASVGGTLSIIGVGTLARELRASGHLSPGSYAKVRGNMLDTASRMGASEEAAQMLEMLIRTNLPGLP